MNGSLGRARDALRSADFRWLLAARLTSQFADGIFQAYLLDRLVFLQPNTQGTVLGVAKAIALLVIPYSLVGPFTGVVIDRWSRRGILTGTPLVRAVAVFLLLPLAGHSVALYAAALVVLSLDRFYLATAGAVMPAVVPDRDLLVGNSLASAVGTVVSFLGLVVASQVAGTVGPAGLVVACAAAWLLSGGMAVGIRASLRATTALAPLRRELGRVVGELAAGARRLAATPAAIGGVVTMTIDQFLFGLVTVLSVVVFKDQFQAGVASYGRIIAAGGVGLIVGILTVGSFEPRVPKPYIVMIAFALAGAATLGVAPHVVPWTILAVSFLLGLAFPWKKIPVDTMVQQSMPDRFRGRVFALYDVGYSMSRVVAALIAIPLIPAVTTPELLGLIGAVYLLWSPVLPWWAGRRQRVGVRFYAGGRADEVPRAIVVGGQDEPVQVLGSWTEEANGTRRRRFRVRGPDSVMDLVEEGDKGRWVVTAGAPEPADR